MMVEILNSSSSLLKMYSRGLAGTVGGLLGARALSVILRDMTLQFDQ